MTKEIPEAPVIFVAGILEKVEGNVKKVFLQTRWKPKTSPIYSGLFEIPGGRINNYENVFDAIKREVEEECGLVVKSCRNFSRGELLKITPTEQSMVFQPFVCQQIIDESDGRLWFGFVFICEVEGEPNMQTDETKDPMWVSLEKLEKLLNEQPDKIYPYQHQALKYYIENTKQS